MQVGIDSYSYHRRYGETRLGERPLPAQIGIGKMGLEWA